MDRKKGYKLDHPELNKDRQAYLDNQYRYDNKTYATDGGAIKGVYFSFSEKGQFDDEHHYDQIKPRNANTSDDLKKKSKNRCILTAIVIAAILVVAVVAAVLAVTLSTESDEKRVDTVERTEERVLKGDVMLKSKYWTDAYNNKNSTEYKTTANEVIDMMDKQLRSSEFSSVYVKTTVESFREGSVIAECLWTFRKTKTFEKTDQPPNFSFDVDTDLFLKTIKEIPEVADITATDVTKCQPNPCKNGAICDIKLPSYVCNCQPGYTGTDCSEELDECGSNPCQNKATCVDKVNGYACSCNPGYSGDHCEKEEKNNCSAKPCYNGGQCFSFLGGSACFCKPEWKGKQCEIRVTTTVSTTTTTTTTTTTSERETTTTRARYGCDSNPCYNGGTCMDFTNGYYCMCRPGWTGAQCQKTYTVTTTTKDKPYTGTTTADKPYTGTTTTKDKPYTGTTTTADKPYTGTTTTADKPYTGMTTTKDKSTTETTTAVKTTASTKSPCGTGVPYDYELKGAILLPYFEDLNFSDRPGYKTIENMVIEIVKNVTQEYGMSMCNQYLKKFFPYKPLSANPENTETNIGFTLVMSMLSEVYQQEVQIMFAYLSPDNVEFISFQALLSTTKMSTTPATTYPVKTCSSPEPKMLYYFNLTYAQQFTTDLYDSTSDSFKKLNQTLSEAFMEQARIENKGQWVCRIDLIRCVPVLSKLDTGSGGSSDVLHVSTEVRLHVPVNTLDINTAAYFFSEAALKSGKIFLIYYDIIYAATTTTTTIKTTKPTTRATK